MGQGGAVKRAVMCWWWRTGGHGRSTCACCTPWSRTTRECAAGHPGAAWQPLDDFLDSHGGLVRNLKAVRDKLLHPLKRSDYQQSFGNLGSAAHRAAPDLYFALEQLQGLLDESLGQLRALLDESLGDEVANLPPGEVASTSQSQGGRVASGALECTSARGHGPKLQMQAHFRSYRLPARGLLVDDVALGRITCLEEARESLALPLPKQPYHKSADSVQTPVAPNLAVWVVMASFGGQVTALAQRLPANVMQHRSGILELLVRSLTLCNESCSALVSRYNSTNPAVPFEALVADEDAYMAAMTNHPATQVRDWMR